MAERNTFADRGFGGTRLGLTWKEGVKEPLDLVHMCVEKRTVFSRAGIERLHMMCKIRCLDFIKNNNYILFSISRTFRS